MLAAFFAINWLAVAVASVALAVLGGVWFGAIIPKAYVAALGREGQPAPKMGPLFIAGPFVCGALTVATTALLMKALAISTYGDALVFGLIVGVGYLVATMTNVAINPNMPRPLFYSVLNAPYFLGASVVASLIVVAMG